MLRTETPVEYFRELVESAMDHQRVHPGELTTYYVVNLLASVASSAYGDQLGRTLRERPAALKLAYALESSGLRRRRAFQELGDQTLFTCGFFADSLRRSTVDLDYYAALGAHAYAWLADHDEGALADVFAELARKFEAFVDVLSEVSERSALQTNADLLRLYERWLALGGRRQAELLAERGLTPPNRRARSRYVQ
jgi:hypothetical protein